MVRLRRNIMLKLSVQKEGKQWWRRLGLLKEVKEMTPLGGDGCKQNVYVSVISVDGAMPNAAQIKRGKHRNNTINASTD